MSRTNAMFLAVAAVAALAATPKVDACTRVVYEGADGRFLTGRTMDWKEDVGTNLWILPRGMARDGAAPNALRWTSKYGSVIASGYDISTADGLNEAGLMVNLQWLLGAEFPRPDGKQPTLSVAIWAQYFLDQFATLAEAVAHARANPVLVVTDQLPGQDRLAVVHISISDATGDSAIFEWINGRLQIHHGRA